MINLLKNKNGSQKFIILIISAVLLVAIGAGIFFYNKTINENVEENPLQNEQNSSEENAGDKKDNEKAENTENKVDETKENANSNATNVSGNTNAVNNIVASNNQNENIGNNQNTTYEEYFQEFVEEKIVNKPWEKLDVSWMPASFDGAILPADTTTRKPVIKLNKTNNVEKEYVTIDDEIIYTISVKNIGNLEAKNIVVTDNIDTEFLEIININDNGIQNDNVITWNLEKVEANQEILLTFTAKVKEISDEKVKTEERITLANTAYAVGENIKDTESNTDEETYLKPIISGQKESFVVRNNEEVEATLVKKGETIKYKVTLTNEGTLSKEVTVEDILPDSLENLAIVSADGEATIEENKITWTVEVPEKTDEEAGVVTLEYTATVKEEATGTVTNGVTLSDGTKVEEVKNAIIDFVKTSEIEGKENSVAATTGDVIVYTVKVINTSDEVAAENITITDTIPEGTKLVEGSITENGTLENGVITWNIEKIEKESFAEVSFKVEVLKNDMTDETGSNTVISNTAYVEESATNTDEIEYVRANFAIEKVANKNVAKVGENITYTITVTNNGTGIGADTITDMISVENVTLDENSISASKGTANFATPNLNWEVTLEVNETATLTYTVNVKENATKVENTVVTPDSSDKTTTPIVEISKEAISTVRPDGKIEYKITVKNTSDVDTEPLVVIDKLAQGLVYNQDANPAENVTYNENTRELKWTNQVVKAGSTNVYTFTAVVDKNITLGTVIKNKAYIDTTSSNETTTKVEEARITAEKSVNKTEVKAGDTLTYTITVKNNGNIPDTATIVDELTSNVSYVEDTLKVDSESKDFATCIENVVKVEDLEVDAGEEVLITFDVVVNENVEEAVVNTAKITTDGKTEETSKTVTNVVTKYVTDENGNEISNDVHYNQILMYNIKLSNKGNDKEATFTVQDKITNGLEYVESSASDNATFANNTLSWNITVAADSEKVLTFKVKVLNTLENLDIISNTATVNNADTNTVTNRYVTSILSSVKKAYVNGDKSNFATNAIKVGDKITYVISVTNNGDYKAENVKVVDTLPNGTKLVSGELSQTIEKIEAKETKSVEFTVEVVDKNKVIKNTATVNGENTNSEVNPYLVISKKSDIELSSKILSDNKVTTGSILKYTIKIENPSEVDAKNVVVKDTVPAGTTIKQDSTHKISEGGVLENSEITWTVDVKAGSYKEVSFYVTVNENKNGEVISNNAYVNGDKTSTSDEYIKAIISGNKEAFVTRNGKKVEAKALKAGDVITYKITILNEGSLESVVEVIDTLPTDKLENIEIATEDVDAKVENGKIIWNAKVPAKTRDDAGMTVLEYTAIVKENAIGTVTNGVTLSDGTKVEEVKNAIIDFVKTSEIEGKENSVAATTGDIIVYTVKVTNTSDEVAAENITITDTIPEGTKLVEGSITENGILENGVITWNIEKIEKESFAEVSFKVEVLKNDMTDNADENTVISNTAYVEESATNTDEIEYVRSNFVVEKVANKNVAKVGEDITYTITVTNNGTGIGTDTITDVISVENVTLDTESITASKGTTNFTAPNLNWEVTLDVNETATLTYTVNVKENATKVENTVVTSDSSDKTTTPVITVVKRAVNSVRLDGTIEYTIAITNTSDIDTEKVVVTDKLAEGLVYNQDANPAENVTYNENTRELKWENQVVKAGSTNVYTFTATIDENISIGTVIKNIAYVDDAASNETTTTVEDYIITANKTVDKASAKVGDTLTYTITLSNSGNIAGVANVEDILVENLSYDANYGIVVANGGSEYTAKYENGKVVVENIKVNPNTNATVTFKAVVNNTVNKAVTNKATITVDGNEEETEETVSTVISKSVSDLAGNNLASQNVKVGDTLVYSITVNNIGNKEAKQVQIKDIVPQGTTFVSATNQVTPNGNNELIWNVEVPANDTLTVTFNVTVNNITDNTKITNIATVDEISTNQVENTYVEPVISGLKTSTTVNQVSGKVVRGNNITYTITAQNDGGLAKEVTISDLIPEGTTFVSATDGIVPNGNNELIWNVEVPAYSSVSKQFVVKVDNDTIIDSITNTATVDGNNTNTTTDNIYYEERGVKFSKRSDTLIGKNLVLVLDVSLSMNEKSLPAEVDTNSPCSSGPHTIWGMETGECDHGSYYDHYYDEATRKWYHYKTKLQLAKETINAFLGNLYNNAANSDVTVDIITFAGSVKNNVRVNKNTYQSTINSFSTYSSTDIDDALVAARNVVKSYTNGNDNMVIFIGDGEPTEGETDADDLGAYADTIYKNKPEDTTIFSIGLAVAENSYADKVLSAIATSGDAELAQDTAGLIEAFNQANIKASFVHDKESTINGKLEDYLPTAGSTAINVVDAANDIVVRYGTGDTDYYTFSPTATQTSIEVLNSEASQALLATKGLMITYDNIAKNFDVNLRNCTINSPVADPVIQIIYY